MQVFGKLSPATEMDLQSLLAECEGISVSRTATARSSNPFPSSTDLEAALVPLLRERSFQHHIRFQHPRTLDGFEYDFWRSDDQVAMEIMGYRADDEVYKDILKFHVHDLTRVGVVWAPRWKWISGRRHDTNYRATMKTIAFADAFLSVEALVAIPYTWESSTESMKWLLSLAGKE